MPGCAPCCPRVCGSGTAPRRSPAQFARWFGDTEDFELIEATVGEVGGRLHLHWRLRLQAERLGAGWFTVEQQAYADTADGGRIARLDLLCTGYRAEGRQWLTRWPPGAAGSRTIRDDPFGHFAEARARCPVQQVRLADGHPAWLVLGYDAARQALKDPRISKDMLAALEDNGDVVAEGLPGPEFSRHMLNVDPPDHTRLRRLVSRAFAPPRIAALEPAIRAYRRQPARRAGRRRARRHRRPRRGIRLPPAVRGDRRTARHPRSRPAAPARLVPVCC